MGSYKPTGTLLWSGWSLHHPTLKNATESKFYETEQLKLIMKRLPSATWSELRLSEIVNEKIYGIISKKAHVF